MSDSDTMRQWLEDVWSQREDKIYRALFTDLGTGVYTSSAAIYERYKRPAAHPGWLHHGVFACPPNPTRANWLYVTSGLSNPWNLDAPGRDPSGLSGLGFELTLETTQPSPWAIQLLHNLMAYELLVAVGSYGDAKLLDYGQRMPLGGPLAPGSPLTWMMVEKPLHHAEKLELPSGKVDLFQLVGITDAEVAFARETSQDMLVGLLLEKKLYPLTDADRKSQR